MLPPALLNIVNRVSGYSTNHVRLEAQGSRSAIGPNQQIRFTLPSNALINLKSFACHFTARASATPNTNAARLPPDARSMFDRVEISIGGVQLQQGSNYANVLNYARNVAFGKREDLLVGHGEMQRNNSYTDSGTIGLVEENPLVARKFLGLLDADVILDSSLVGDIVVTLHTAGADVISVSGNPTSPAAMTSDISGASGSYQINDLFASIEVMQMGDSTFSEMNRRIIAEKGYLEIAYKNYVSSVQNHGGASRFTVATQSLDRVWVMLRRLVDVAVGKAANGVHGTSAGSVSVDPNVQLSGEMYIPSVFTSNIPTSNATYQLSLNGAMYPQFQADPQAWAEISRNSVSDMCDEPYKYVTRPAFRTQQFVLCARLNLPGSEKSRTISGLDTRGVSLTGQFISHNDGSNTHQSLIFAECTASLRIGPGRTIEVIH